MEDLGVWRNNMVQSVTSNIDGNRRRGEVGHRSQQTIPIIRVQVQRGQEEIRGIEIETDIEGKGRGRVHTESGVKEAF